MKALLDASVVLRYLIDSSSAQGNAAATWLESEHELAITPTTLAEISHVLLKVYEVPRSEVLGALRDLVNRSNLQVVGLERSLVLQALSWCEPSNRVSVPDALLWAEAAAHGVTVVTYDRRFPSQGISVRHPDQIT